MSMQSPNAGVENVRGESAKCMAGDWLDTKCAKHVETGKDQLIDGWMDGWTD